MSAKQLKRIAFVAEDFSVRSPVQQLLDRFLIGYPRDGEFHQLSGRPVIVLSAAGNAESGELQARVRDFGLLIVNTPVEAVADVEAAVVVWRGSGGKANHTLLENVLQKMPEGARCFVHGTLANTRLEAQRLAEVAASRQIALSSGGSIGVTYRLPNVEIPSNARIGRGLIVVQGSFPDAEFEALDGLLPIMARRRGGEAGVSRVRLITGNAVWESGKSGEWPWPLLAAAISRSNTVQGDPLRDGRTQDVVGLGLVPTLAKDPRCWLLEHRDGVKSTILVLDGVVADYNFAVQLSDRTIISAQLYRPPPPMQDQFSRLAAVIEEFLGGGAAPWPIERSLVLASVLEAFAKNLHG